MSLTSVVASSIAPFDPTIAIAGVAGVALTIFVAILAFIALAPVVSANWSEQLHATPNGGPSLEAEPSDAD